MKVGIISDTHGDVRSWHLACGVWKHTDMVLHAGDVLNYGPRESITEDINPAALARAILSHNAPVMIARGNCDSDIDEQVLRIPMVRPYVFLSINDISILMTHGDLYETESLKELAQLWKIDILITGHTHCPQLLKSGSTIFMNPGSPSLPKNGAPTAGILHINESVCEASIWDIASGRAIME